MRIIVNHSAGVLSEAGRAKLERIFSVDAADTVNKLRDMFPGQLVTARYGHVQIARKDGSLIADIFQDGSNTPRWIESKVNLTISKK